MLNKKTKQGESKMNKVIKIKVKKFGTFKEAYKYQKELTGKNFDDHVVKCKYDHKMDLHKNNNFPYMVDEKGNIFYVFSCPEKQSKLPLNILHKMDTIVGLNDSPLSRAYIGKNKIIITSKYKIPKKDFWRGYVADKGWFVTGISSIDLIVYN
tara:strand:+ start:140 stop:598 length:459 start_codon:yes stop_codon:yes gene_type:complete